MRPTVKLIEGYHLTATNRRIIVEGILLLRDSQDWDQWIGRKGSRHRYQITPDPAIPNRFRVVILENYRSGQGKKRQHETCYVVDVRGLAPIETSEQLQLL